MSPLQICHQCPHRQRPCAGKCACTLDGEDIITHAESRYCPAGKYQLGLGDTVARVLHATKIGPAYQAAHKKITGKPCTRCPKRQKDWNTLAPSRPSDAP